MAFEQAKYVPLVIVFVIHSLRIEALSIFDNFYRQEKNLLRGPQTYPVHPIYDEAGDGFVECGTRTISFEPRTRGGKIVGGSESPYGAYPWQVEIKILKKESKKFSHLCGGAIVGTRTIVTAAHCFEQYPIKVDEYRIVTGDHRLKVRDPQEHSYKIRKILIHPEYKKYGPHSNDIAVMIVGVGPEGIPFSSHVRPICMPKNPPPPGPCAVTGWGFLQEDVEVLAPVLRAASVPLVDLETCRMSGINGGRQQPILDTMLCAGVLRGGVDACHGDSGGPLACERDGRFELTGLVSWGDGCGKKNRLGVYTKVSSYINWIQSIARQMGENL